MTNPIAIKSFLFPTVLWVWGANAHGELGDAADVGTNHPITTSFFPSGTTLRKLSAGDGAPLGGSHSLAVDDAQHAWGWGLNTFGEVGNGQGGVDSFLPAQVCGTGQTAPCTQFIESIVAVAAGGFHSLALDGFGTVWGWGFNQSGQVGISSGPTAVPVRNNALFAQLHQQPGTPVATAIAAGSNHSLALDSNGIVWAWGDNSSGQLGNGSFSYPPDSAPYIAWPVTFPEPASITAIAAGGQHGLALDSNGALWSWGSNEFGQLGLSSFAERLNSPNKLIYFPPNTRIVAIAGGATHSLAIDAAGKVWAFGRNQAGQLGNQTSIDSHGPTQVVFPPGTPGALTIAAGGDHSLAVDAHHNLWAWGLNASGQLGNPEVGNTTAPVLCQFPQPVRIITMAAGTAHSLALESRSFLFGLEAVLDLDPATKELRVLPHSLSSAPITVETKESLEREAHQKRITVQMSDTENHKLVFTIAYEKHDGKVILELRSLQYNRREQISPGSNRVEYEISADKSGAVRLLDQHCTLHSGAARLEITAHYRADRGETTIHLSSEKHPRREFTRRGMAVIRMGTMSGTIGFSDGIATWTL